MANLPAGNRFSRTLLADKLECSFSVKICTRYILLYTIGVPLETNKSQILSMN